MLGRDMKPSESTFTYLATQLSNADLALANLESPLTDAPSQTRSDYVLCAPLENAAWLAEWGLDVLTLANNHILDCGQDGRDETITVLMEQGLIPVGPGMVPVHLEIRGLHLSILALDDVSAPLDVGQAVTVVQSERQAGMIVIVSIHWGMEYQGGASGRQEEIASQLTDAGADLIWGHHPHVLQRIDMHQGMDGDSLVIYSLGNALFDQHGLPSTRQGALVSVVLNENGISRYKVIPFVIDVEGSRIVQPDTGQEEQILDQLGEDR